MLTLIVEIIGHLIEGLRVIGELGELVSASRNPRRPFSWYLPRIAGLILFFLVMGGIWFVALRAFTANG